MESKRSPVTLCVTSGKGGVGKTSFTVNLAIALTMKGFRVLVVDGDMGLANVDVLLRLSVKTTINTVINTGSDPSDTLIFPRTNLGILPGSSGVPEMVNLGDDEQKALGTFLSSVSSGFDYVIIDTAAGIGSSVIWFNRFSMHNIFILSSDPTSLTDAYALIKVLSGNHGTKKFNIVMNFIKNRKEGLRTFETIRKVTKKFLDLDIGLLGCIHEDKAVRKAILDQVPFIERSPKSKASKDIMAFVENIHLLK